MLKMSISILFPENPRKILSKYCYLQLPLLILKGMPLGGNLNTFGAPMEHF